MIPKRKSTLQYSLPTLTVGGVCAGSYGDYYNWTVSPTPCTIKDYIYLVEYDNTVNIECPPCPVVSGLCSQQTESALLQQDCINNVWSLPGTARVTIQDMVRSMCRVGVYDNFNPRPVSACASDCITVLTSSGTVTYQDPGCLTDCGDLVQDSCLSLLFSDYDKAGGVCQGSHADVELSWPTSQSVCSVENVYGPDPLHVVEGLCRPETEAALLRTECIQQVWDLQYELERDRIREMIRSLCNTDVWYDFNPQPVPKCRRDCVEIIPKYSTSYYEDPACLHDCETPSCLSLLVADHQTHGGVCEESYGDVNYNWTVSPTPCITEDFVYESYDYELDYDWDDVVSGLCSEQTESALLQQDCINTVWSLPGTARVTIQDMVRSMCRQEISDNFKLRPAHPCSSDCITVLTPSGAAIFEDPVSCLADCPATVSPNTNTISSPNYPDNYPDYAHLYYLMTAQPGQTIEITFTDFEIESINNSTCPNDWVVIVDGDGTELLPKSCRSQIPEIIETRTKLAILIFVSDSRTNRKGFQASLSDDVGVVLLNVTDPGANTRLSKEREVGHQSNFNSNNKDPSRLGNRTRPQRLNPIEEVVSYGLAIKPTFEDTKGRYPWLCSLRSKSDKSHYCGTTILSRPPGPLVMVTAAHCVHLCKSEDGNTRPNCCCENVSGVGCSAESQIECGVSPSVEVMTGQDAEVICGEFQTGNLTAEESGEEWNIVLGIEKIIVHPDYNITRGENRSQYVYADMATLHLNEDLSEEEISLLTPICLPQPHDATFGVHAGWSSPPPVKFIVNPAFEPFLPDFNKLWHYNMSLIECQDPTQYFRKDGFITGVNLTYPTNSFYPQGTICARERYLQFCPTSGESGSPLMVENDEGKFSAVGVNSFIKGCIVFQFRNRPDWTALRQVSGNPSVYSRLSCFLPWIAEQYRMNYTATEEDEKCKEGTGDINEVGGDQCRTTPTTRLDIEDKKEALCIFPFYLDGIEYNQCTLTEIRDFTRPRFICPIREG